LDGITINISLSPALAFWLVADRNAVAGVVRRKAAGDRMATDLSKFYGELRRLKRENPKLGRRMLEHYLRAMYREELNLNANGNLRQLFRRRETEKRTASGF
jgi:hypothetical protein